jgi:hypothetical protein
MSVRWINRAFIAHAEGPGETGVGQERALERIVQRARGSLFGVHHHLDEVRTIADYQARVPVHEYSKIEPWWSRIEAGETNVVTDEPIVHFALTSGTTGRQKRVPITPTFLANVRATQRHAMAMHMRRFPSSAVLLGHAVALAGRSRIATTAAGIPMGMVSGIIVEASHPIVRWRGVPSLSTLNEPDWDRKLERMVGEATGKQVGIVGGIASAVLSFLAKGREQLGSDGYRTLTRSIEVIVTSGVDYRIYREALVAAVGHPLAFCELYGSSEGFLGYASWDDPDSFELYTDHVFFELIPAEQYGQPSAPRRLVTECEAGREYVLAVTNGSGAFSYVLGDLLRCVYVGPRPRFKLAGRVHLTLNLVTEKTTVPAVEGALLDLARELGGMAGEFFVTARTGGARPRYVWALEDLPVWRTRETSWLARRLDELLSRHNEHYRAFLGTQLDPAEVVLLDPVRIRAWLDDRGGDSGHRKLPRIQPDPRVVAALIP